jgi:hypothetical protein
MSIRDAMIPSILSTSESGICTGDSSLDGLGEYCNSCRESTGEKLLSGGGGKGRCRPRVLGEGKEPPVLSLGSLYGPRELVADPGPRAISLSRRESPVLLLMGTNGSFSGRILVVALEIVYGAVSAGKCVARASGVISFASKSEFRPEITFLRRCERRQKRKPTTKANKMTPPTMVPAISPVFEGFDGDDLIEEAASVTDLKRFDRWTYSVVGWGW